MRPSYEEIQFAAYQRFESRGGGHGHDRDDWELAEQSLLFSGNYAWIFRTGAGAEPPAVNGHARQQVCRFCEQAAPRVKFTGQPPALPDWTGLARPAALDQCDECREQFVDGVDREVPGFLTQILPEVRKTPSLSIAALKGLARAALSVLPSNSLDLFPDAIEWVSNPDHEMDRHSLPLIRVLVHEVGQEAPGPWFALAHRTSSDFPGPMFLAFAGFGTLTLEYPIPFCSADEELDGEHVILPRVALPSDIDRPWFFPRTIELVPTAAPKPARRFPGILN